MNSEDYSITENSSLTVERGQQNNTTYPHFAKHHEGSLQVPIPCAVLCVVIITVLTMSFIALSVGKYNCPSEQTSLLSSNNHASSCSDNWLGYQKKCYFMSKEKRNWTSAQNKCFEHGATLAVIDFEKDMIFFKTLVGGTKYWIRLKSENGQTWKWSNGKQFDKRLNPTESTNCAFLNSTDISSTECEKNLQWICSKLSS